MGITYNAGTNTITVTGYTEAVPCTFHDIKLAEMSGAWNCIDEAHGIQFNIRCKIILGDGTNATWFKDTKKQVRFYDFGSWVSMILVNNNASFIIIGCAFYSAEDYRVYLIMGEPTSVIEIYSSFITGIASDFAVLAKINLIHNSILEGIYLSMSSTLEMENVYMAHAPAYYTIFGCAGSWDKITVKNAVNGLGLGGSFLFLPAQHPKNVVIRNCTHAIRCYDMDMDCSITNGDIDSWTIDWAVAAGASSAKLYRKYEFDLKVIQDNSARTPIQGATVKIWDKDNTLVTDTTTDANGNIATQILNYGYYDDVHGNTCQMQTPHKIEIRKASTMYKSVVKYMYMAYVRKEVVAMVNQQPIQFCDDDLILQLAPTSEKDDRFIYTKV